MRHWTSDAVQAIPKPVVAYPGECDLIGLSLGRASVQAHAPLIGTLKAHNQVIRELKQARTATAVNKQLNFTVKNKPHTTNYIYCIFEAYFMMKSV